MFAHTSEHQSKEQHGHSAHHGEGIRSPWVKGLHNAQRTAENVYAPYELWHHMLHGTGKATRASAPAAGALAESTGSEMTALVENVGRASAADQAAVQAGRALRTVSGTGRVLGGLGAVGGALELVEGFEELDSGEREQGGLDLAAGGLGLGSGGLALAGISCPPLAVGAAGVGAMAYGHKETKRLGVWGQNDKGENRSSWDFVRDATSAVYQNTNRKLGGGILGKIGGGMLAGTAALGTATDAVLGDLVGGVIAAGVGAYDLGKSLVSH